MANSSNNPTRLPKRLKHKTGYDFGPPCTHARAHKFWCRAHWHQNKEGRREPPVCIKKPQRASTKKRILSKAPGAKTQHVRAKHIPCHWGGQGPFSARAQSLGAKRRWGNLLRAQAITRHQEILGKCLSSDEGTSKYLACSSLHVRSTHPCLPTLLTSFQMRHTKKRKKDSTIKFKWWFFLFVFLSFKAGNHWMLCSASHRSVLCVRMQLHHWDCVAAILHFYRQSNKQ